MKRWMNLGVSGQCGWPDREREVSFGENRLVLKPRTRETSSSVHIETHSRDDLEEMTTINRFLSIISWSYKDSLQNDYGWSGNPVPVAVPAKTFVRTINPYFLTKWNPLPEPKQRLAVALYREAMSINSVPYQFLGFFKIINILYKSGPQQIDWIRETLPKLPSSDVQKRLAEVESEGADAARYFYEAGRCAVAHAFSEPLVDPDDLKDLRRLSSDLDVARALAEYLIKHELHVPDYP